MMKKTMFMLGIASIGISSCSKTKKENETVPVSGAVRIVTVDSVNDRVTADTSARAIAKTGNATPKVVITGLRSKKIYVKKDDLLLYEISSATSLLEKKKLVSFRLFHAN